MSKTTPPTTETTEPATPEQEVLGLCMVLDNTTRTLAAAVQAIAALSAELAATKAQHEPAEGTETSKGAMDGLLKIVNKAIPGGGA